MTPTGFYGFPFCVVGSEPAPGLCIPTQTHTELLAGLEDFLYFNVIFLGFAAARVKTQSEHRCDRKQFFIFPEPNIPHLFKNIQNKTIFRFIFVQSKGMSGTSSSTVTTDIFCY